MQGRALAGFAQDLDAAGANLDRVVDRERESEEIADAQDRDAAASQKIRELLYSPESGFLNSQGSNAVNARKSAQQRIETILKDASAGATPGVARRIHASMLNRGERAYQSIDRHVSTERSVWLNGSSNARMESAFQDSLVQNDPGQTASAIQTIQHEVDQIGQREGWSPEQLEVEKTKRTSELLSAQITQMAAADPQSAMDYLIGNQSLMFPEDVANLEIKLQPAIKQAIGRAKGAEAFVGTGNLTAAFEIASDTLGMNEKQQNAALRAYLKDGGVNLDPAVTAWCAAHVNATLAKAGMSGTGSNMARSFLNWGDEVVTAPQKGDVVVLERGEPPYGHVGFFDSYNEDGSINILGGNQGDSVSVQSYDAARVLGIRRKVNPDANTAARGLGALVGIKDPIEREAAINEYNLRVGVIQGQRTASLAAAQNAAFEMIEGGGSLDSLPIDIRQSLGQESMTSLRSYQNTLAKGETVQTDDATYYELRQMQSSNPAAFRDLNLLTYRDKLDDADFQKMVDAQTKPSSDITTSAASTLMTTATRQLSAAGIDTTPKPGSDDAQKVSAIQTRLLRWQDAFVEENKRAPTQPEIDSRIGQELVEVVIDPLGPFGDRTSRMFEIDFDGATFSEDDDMTGEQFFDAVASNELTIRGVTVTREHVSTVTDLLRISLNRDPDLQEIMRGLAELYR